jgi:hypothetical protein
MANPIATITLRTPRPFVNSAAQSSERYQE